MRPIAEMSTVQIEITSACPLRCSNCTRFCGTHTHPFFITMEQLRAAVDSLVEYSKEPHAVVGFMGGDPLLHPQFSEFCDYALSKIERAKLGLWTTFPHGDKFKAYRDVICRTFGNILLNDHSRDDILHAPVLMAAEDHFRKECRVCHGLGAVALPPVHVLEPMLPTGGYRCDACDGTGKVADDAAIFAATERCWIQESWSASVNPKGAWFCEVAGALSDLFDGPEGWKVEPGWWKRTTKDYTEQREWACRKCGAALPLTRIRTSQDNKDDVSTSNLERLKAIKSRKVARGEYEVRPFEFDKRLINNTYPSQTYKDREYRQGIAARYDMYLVMNARGYWEPHLMEDGGYCPAEVQEQKPPSLFKIFQEQYQ